jgi:uncharacterized DUF497 family protein
VEVEWDHRKAATNLKKHGVDFADAVTALHDRLAVTIEDVCGSEERFVTIGVDALGRLLVAVYTYRKGRLRLISARKATSAERRQYED